MKRKELIKRLENMGCNMIRHGGKHDWYQNPKTKMCQPIPGHSEIKDTLAHHIIKMLDSDKNQFISIPACSIYSK